MLVLIFHWEITFNSRQHFHNIRTYIYIMKKKITHTHGFVCRFVSLSKVKDKHGVEWVAGLMSREVVEFFVLLNY